MNIWRKDKIEDICFMKSYILIYKYEHLLLPVKNTFYRIIHLITENIAFYVSLV